MPYIGKTPSKVPLDSSDIADGTITNDDLAGSITSAKITSLDATKLTGSVPSSALTNVDLSKLEYNQAILAFKVASANQLAKFSMVDQVIDEYQDATGVDAGASTNESAQGATTAKYYEGGTTVTPTTSSVGSVASTGTVDGDYTYYKWLSGSTGTFTTDTAQDYEYLVVGGGGSAADWGGGGGGGGYRTATGFAVAATTITGITVGIGGTANGNGQPGNRGGNSVFSTITSTGGGGGNGDGIVSSSGTGGSGGGGSYYTAGVTFRAGHAGNLGGFSPVEGYAGGSSTSGSYGGAGGGGAGGVGADSSGDTGSAGGIGINNDITGTTVGYAGGGGGGSSSGTGGTASHGGGAGGTGSSGVVGTANTGGGAGADPGVGKAGGTGIVVIRRLTTVTSSGGNLTLQSVATTAESAPTTADLVVLIEDGAGTATVNTDIKGFVSRNGSAFSSEVVFVDEGDWGTNKRILVARNIDISGITTGTAMKYKLTTHNQSASSKETRIHATSLAWA